MVPIIANIIVSLCSVVYRYVYYVCSMEFVEDTSTLYAGQSGADIFITVTIVVCPLTLQVM